MIVDLASEADFQLGALQVRPSIRQVEAGGASEALEPRMGLTYVDDPGPQERKWICDDDLMECGHCPAYVRDHDGRWP